MNHSPGAVTNLAGRVLELSGGTARVRRSTLHFRDGRIEQISEPDPSPASGDRLLMPPLVNAHDHARGVRPSALGGFDLPLELWVIAMSGAPRIAPYLVAAALGRQALSGVGAMAIHYTRPQNAERLPEELRSVRQAAKDIGVRIGIAVGMRDRNPLAYGGTEKVLSMLDAADRHQVRERLMRPPRSAAEQVRLVEELAAELEDGSVNVQFGPVGVEWCSQELLCAIAQRSAETGRRVHMHLLETKTQREYLDFEIKQGVVRFLDSIGLLSPRLSVAHGVWLRPDEMELLAERGVTVSVNASSNFTLRSGTAPMVEFARHGVPVGLGLDGFSMDDDDDALRELRLNYLLHRGAGFEPGILPGALLHAACCGGRHAVLGEDNPTVIAPGMPADILAMDYRALSADVIAENVGEASLLLHRATRRHVEKLIVAGREVVAHGRLTGIDIDAIQKEIDQQLVRGAGEFNAWQAIARRLQARLRDFYEERHHTHGGPAPTRGESKRACLSRP